jgi:alkyldihydroxyacetonephosphate synthase
MRRWNGWGEENRIFPLTELAKNYLKGILGAGEDIQDITFEDALRSVPDAQLPNNSIVSVDPEDRLRHACGQSLPDWINLHSGRIPKFPDGIIYPSSEEDVRAAMEFARSNKIILIPYGGGTSVVGHINPPVVNTPTITVDLSRLNNLLEIDQTSRMATFEAGVKGPEIENQLNHHGYTLGHFPQSFEYSTLGGWIATRSSGQQSFYYGRIEDLFKGGHVETPQGPFDLAPFPASAAGPDLRQLVLGSEGRFGILTKAYVAIRPLPEHEAFYGLFFKDWESGISAVREIAQEEIQLSMIRLYDPRETEITLLLSGRERMIRWGDIGLNRLGYRDHRCLMIFGVTGAKNLASRNRREATRICQEHGGFFVGKFIGDAWKKSRFTAPYLRNTLWEMGYALDTLETASIWSNLLNLKDKLFKAIMQAANMQGEPLLLFGHLSHIYLTGASIYVTYIFKRKKDPAENIESWRLIKNSKRFSKMEARSAISMGLDWIMPHIYQKKKGLWD